MLMPSDPTVDELRKAFENAPYLSNKHESYFASYAKLLAPYRGKDITFVEVGIFSGGSLFMWREFLGPQARVIGVEFNPDAVRWREAGFEIFIGSQSDPEFWKSFFETVGSVDVLLDDGGHTYEQQISTVHHALPWVKDQGLIIVEDTHTSYFKAFGYPSAFTFIEWVKVLIDNINSRCEQVAVSTLPYSKIVHSVEIFESIVAFKVDKRICISSKSISNGRDSVDPEDFRFKDFETKIWWLPAGLRTTNFGRRLANSLAKRAHRRNLRRLKGFFD